MRDHGFVIEAVGQAAYHDGGSVTIVVGIALDVPREPQVSNIR